MIASANGKLARKEDIMIDDMELVYFKNILTRQLQDLQRQADGTVINLLNQDA